MGWKVDLKLRKKFPTLAKAEKGMKSLIKRATALDWEHKLEIKEDKKQ